MLPFTPVVLPSLGGPRHSLPPSWTAFTNALTQLHTTGDTPEEILRNHEDRHSGQSGPFFVVDDVDVRISSDHRHRASSSAGGGGGIVSAGGGIVVVLKTVEGEAPAARRKIKKKYRPSASKLILQPWISFSQSLFPLQVILT